MIDTSVASVVKGYPGTIDKSLSAGDTVAPLELELKLELELEFKDADNSALSSDVKALAEHDEDELTVDELALLCDERLTVDE